MSRGVNAGNRNQGSNWCSKAKRAWIHNRDDHRCAWCGRYFKELTVDHIVPRAEGGTNEVTNLITACMPCNRLRGTKPALNVRHYGSMSIDETRVMLAVAMLTPKPRRYEAAFQ